MKNGLIQYVEITLGKYQGTAPAFGEKLESAYIVS